MSAGDGTGPMGMGPKTGRAVGLCARGAMPGAVNPIPGRGFGMGVAAKVTARRSVVAVEDAAGGICSASRGCPDGSVRRRDGR